jgi:plasmid stabilization system protein ParE
MKYELIIRSCAEKDIADAINWYEEKVKGLGENFLISLDEVFQSILRNPEAFPKVYKEFRRALMSKYPYSIFYIITRNKIIVIAVFHEKRNPEIWKNRAK